MKRWLVFGMLVALALAAWLWLANRSASQAPELPQPASKAPASQPKTAAEPQTEPETVREELHDAAPKPAEPAAAPAGIALTLRFISPDGKEARVESSRVRLTDPAGRVIERSTEVAWSVDFAGLAPVRYAADVQAPGYTHRPEEIDLSGHSSSEEGLRESLVLWSKFCIAVVAQTEDGRPLRALAEALGIEPKCLFVDAFSARVLSENPGGAVTEFVKPPNYQQWELSESVVGTLLLGDPPPFWVALDFHGQLVGKQRLEPRQTEIVFKLSLASLEASLASLRLRVFEAQGDSPVAGAKVTLRADTSAHRRRDQQDVLTRADGSVEFARIVPGRYELVVEHGASEYQDRIDLAPAVQRDLGIVRLSGGTQLRIRVVDERGEAQRAWLEIGPYETGRDVRDLYPPMLHEYTREDGVGKLRMPARLSIVRAQQMTERGLGPNGRSSASVRIDPNQPPSGEVQLVILDTAHLDLSCRMPEARRLQLHDELGLIVLDESLLTQQWKEHRRTLELGRGRYELRLLGTEDVILYQRTIVLRAGEQELELP